MPAMSPAATPPFPSLREAQRSFMAQLYAPVSEAPAGLLAEPGLDRGIRFGVYHHAYRARLRAVLRTDHAAVAHALGDRFEAVADGYIAAHPSVYSSLRRFGDAFPGFVGALPGAGALGALARFERALLGAFDAADAPRCGLAELAAATSTGAPLGRIALHPSVRVLVPGWNVVDAWHAARADRSIPPWIAESTAWVLWRSVDRRTSFRAVGSPEKILLEGSRRGWSVTQMCETLVEVMPVPEIPAFVVATVRRWLDDGMISKC